MKRTFGVIGGDRRQMELVRRLREDGHMVVASGLEEEDPCGKQLSRAAEAEVILLPLPLCRKEGMLNCRGMELPTCELFQLLRPEQLVLAGKVKGGQLREAEVFGLDLVDYFLREELTVANAALTAEAALLVAEERREKPLAGANCLVLGYGRIGKFLCRRLQGLGAVVTAAARKESDRVWIRAFGWRALDTAKMSGNLREFDVVFNTIPALIFGENLLGQLPGDCLLVELASVQGMDLAAADTLGLSNVWARSLPGHRMPAAAALVIRDAVYSIMRERGDL